MNNNELIQQAKYFFGRDRKPIKKIIMSYEFDGSHYKQWTKNFKSIINNPVDIHFGIFDDVILNIKDKKLREINWNWIGDFSWRVDILLNEGVKNGLDWDVKLAAKCNGTIRYFTVFISELLPCYTYDFHYATYNRRGNYYEFGPIKDLQKKDQHILKEVNSMLKQKGLIYLDRKICEQRFEELLSDTNENGGATIFDVLFSDTTFYQTEIKRTCIRQVIEKSGAKYRWTEFYNPKKVLKERIEYRYFSSGDSVKTIFDVKGQIKSVEVERKVIGRKKHQKFSLDIA